MPPVTMVTLSADGYADFSVPYNPNELTFDKQMQYAEITIPGLDAPLQQFVRGNAERLTIELFFDSTEKGMGLGAQSVTALTDKVF
ncbi:MAG TPA: peptidoglycan-binding protein, partial [Polyangia bacterium]|nr:peptidoglycan-binding protein [Polyangia bacterium]